LFGQPEINHRGFAPLNEKDTIMAEAVRRVVEPIREPGDHISEVGLLKSQIKDGVSRFLYEQTEAATDGLPGSSSRSRWRHAVVRPPPGPGRGRPPRVGRADAALSPDVTRSLVAVVLMVLGAVILIGLVFQGRGALTDWIPT